MEQFRAKNDRISSLSPERRGEIAAVLAAVLFGTMPLFTRIAYAGGSNSYMASFLRFSIASVILALLGALTRRFSLKVSAKEFAAISLPALFLGLTAVLLYPSYNYISTALATTLHFTYPVWVMLILALVLREKISGKQVMSLILCMAGICMLHTPGEQGALQGVVLAVLSGVALAIYTVLLGKRRPEGLSALTVCFWTDVCAAIVSGICAYLTGSFTLALTPQGWIASVLLAVTASVLAVLFYQMGVLLCGGLKTSLLGSLEPPTGILIGMLVYHERMTALAAAGIALILAAALVALHRD